MRRAMYTAVVALTIGVVFAGTASARSIHQQRGFQLVAVIANCSTPQLLPSSIITSCADRNSYLDAIHWTYFGVGDAHGTGIFHINDCTPDCVNGRWHAYPGAAITLSSITRIPGVGPLYATLLLSYMDGPRTSHHEFALPTSLPG